MRQLLCLTGGGSLLVARAYQRRVRLIVAARINRSLGVSRERRRRRVRRIEHRPAFHQGSVLRCDLAEFGRYLLRRHVLLAHDAEEADHRSLREAQLSGQFRHTSLGFRPRLAADRNLLRKNLDQAKLFSRRRSNGDRAVGDGLRCHPARRLNPGLCRHSNRREHDQSHQYPAGMAAPDHDYFVAGGAGGAGLTVMGLFLISPAATPFGALIVTCPP